MVTKRSGAYFPKKIVSETLCHYIWWITFISSRMLVKIIILTNSHDPLTRCVKLMVAHAPGLRERFPRHRLQRKPLVSDPGIHHGTCATHVPWCLSGLLTRGGGENVPGIPGACATRNFTYLARGPCCYHLFPECLTSFSRINDRVFVE